MTEVRPARRLTSNCLRQALRAFIVPPICKSFQVISIRALWDAKKRDEELAEDLIAVKRRQLEILLGRHSNIVSFVSCITGVQIKSKKREEMREKMADFLAEVDDEELPSPSFFSRVAILVMSPSTCSIKEKKKFFK